MCVDVRANHKSNDVEKRHPGVLGQEFLRKRQGQRGGDPADLHNRQKPSPDRCPHLMEGPRTGDDGHRGEIDGVLDGRDLANSQRQSRSETRGRC